MFKIISETASGIKRVINFIWNHPNNKSKKAGALAGAVFWQVYKRVIGTPVVYTLENKLKIILTKECVVSSAVIYVGVPEYEEVSFIRKYMSADKAVIDVGANIGHFSLLFADKAFVIHAFEPTMHTFERLSENFGVNYNYKLFAHRMAISDYCGSGTFLSQGGGNTTNRLTSNIQDPRVVNVEVTTLDKVVCQYEIDKISLLKIDVEGFEMKVLKGGLQTIAKCQPEIIMFESLNKKEIGNFIRFFEDFNYVVFRVNNECIPVLNGLEENDNLLAMPKDRFEQLK